MKRWMIVLICMTVAAVVVQTSSAADLPAIVVGRINYIEGELLRYVPEVKDWVAAVKDAPFGTEDTLYSGTQGMAELIVPNRTWIRIGDSTQIQFIDLDADLTEADVASGVARFYNKGSTTVIKATNSFGYVLAYPGTVFDFYVGENSVEVIAVKGQVSFVHSATNAKYDLAAGSPSILADSSQVSSGDGDIDPSWDQWNSGREAFWVQKNRMRGRSIEYLPPSLQDEAYALEENGSWERIRYEGGERLFWRPTLVSVGWAPFTAGRWTEWGGDQCWIPDEPFGYVTHHYGNWIYVGSYWYWAPPVVSVRVGVPLLDVGFFWGPGRVSWIHSGAYVGWVPLAPNEVYYGHRRWGGRHDVVISNMTNINVNIRNYAFARQAIVINQSNFFNVNNYRNVRVTNINNTTIINNYRAAPVINNTVINNYTTNNQRYNYTNVVLKEKPHNTVINRIQQNETIIRAGKRENPAMLEQQVKKLPEGKVNREARIEQPKVTNNIVPANEVNKPKSEMKPPQREIKGAARGSEQGQPRKVGGPELNSQQPGQPSAKPERIAPAKPAPPGAEPGQPAAKPERVRPERPGQAEQPAAKPEQITPSKPERIAPAKPAPPGAEPGQPAAKPERVRPERPGQAEQPAAKPEQITPSKPERIAPAKPAPPGAEPGQPSAKPERVKPRERPEQGSQPVQPAQPAAKPERVVPAKPAPPPQVAPPQQPAPKPERVAPPKPAGPSPAKPEPATPTKPGERNKPQDEAGQPEKLR